MLLGVIYLRLFVRLILSTSLSFESFCFLWPKLAKAKVKVFHIICIFQMLMVIMMVMITKILMIVIMPQLSMMIIMISGAT